MKITKVAFEKTIGMPNYSNDKPIVVECILEGDETKEEAWTKLNQDMIAWHQKEYPNLYEKFQDHLKLETHQGLEVMRTQRPPFAKEVTQEPIIRSKQPEDQRIAMLIADIYSCGDLKILESYKVMARAKPELQAAYDAQLIKLTGK